MITPLLMTYDITRRILDKNHSHKFFFAISTFIRLLQDYHHVLRWGLSKGGAGKLFERAYFEGLQKVHGPCNSA